MKCRHCEADITLSLLDLGSSPPSNSYLTARTLRAPELWFPLRVLVCEQCWLVQTEDFTEAEKLFDSEYAYFSGFSSTWLDHCERYVDEMIERFDLDGSSLMAEVATNDGSLLQFALDRGIPCLGIEPTESTAEAARQKGVPIVQEFFGVSLASELAKDGKAADLVAANNVLAHVPDINDFVAAFSRILKPNGVATFEFPHLSHLIRGAQFDTIYHEHFSYLSLTAVRTIFSANGLEVFDVEEVPTHGGSLRVFAQRSDSGRRVVSARVAELALREQNEGVTQTDYYSGFQSRADTVKDEFIEFLLAAKTQGKMVCGYGAAAKGNTLLNYAGIKGDLISFVVDRNPAKQGKFLPGSRIPIVNEEWLRRERPEYVLLLPWNLKNELIEQLDYVRGWNGKFVTAVPQLTVE